MTTLRNLEQITSDYINRPNERLTTPVFNALLPDYSKVQDTVRASRAKVDQIERDRNLSVEGKQKAHATMANEHITNYAFIGGQRTKNAERIRNLHTMNYGFLVVPEEKDPTKALIRELRAAEIRSLHRTVESRDALFISALEQDRLELVHAILNAPDGAWVSDDIRQRGAELYAKRVTPEPYAELQDAFTIREHLDMLAECVRLAFTALGGDPEKIARVIKVQS